MVRKVAATRAWAGVGDATARRRRRGGVGAASAGPGRCPASVAVTGSEKSLTARVGAPEGMGAGDSQRRCEVMALAIKERETSASGLTHPG